MSLTPGEQGCSGWAPPAEFQRLDKAQKAQRLKRGNDWPLPASLKSVSSLQGHLGAETQAAGEGRKVFSWSPWKVEVRMGTLPAVPELTSRGLGQLSQYYAQGNER